MDSLPSHAAEQCPVKSCFALCVCPREICIDKININFHTESRPVGLPSSHMDGYGLDGGWMDGVFIIIPPLFYFLTTITIPVTTPLNPIEWSIINYSVDIILHANSHFYSHKLD